ncbi:MAG: hypothetical protein AABW64_02600 [Nanoarchaeota archaeon]
MDEQSFRVKVIIEVLGGPEAHVQATIKKVVEKVKELKEMKVLKDQIFETTQVEKRNLWTTFCELEMQANHIQALMDFCFDFMPSSVEILEPQKFTFTAEPISNLLNDLIGRLHQYDMFLKNAHAENISLKKKIESLES